MTDEELVALYGSVKEMAAAMKAREAVLEEETLALSAAITQLRELPEVLGRQTGQFIADGVKQSIRDDFRLPVADAVKGPIAELNKTAYHARNVIAEIGRYERFHAWIWMGCILLLGCLLGGTATYYLVVRELNSIHDQMDAIQMRLAPPTPMPARPENGRKHHLQ